MEYKILYDSTNEDLSRQIQDHASDGWTPLGEVSIIDLQNLSHIGEKPYLILFARGVQKIDGYDDSQQRGEESI